MGSGVYIAETERKRRKTSADWQTLELLVRLMQNSAVCSVKGGQLYIFFFFYDMVQENRSEILKLM